MNNILTAVGLLACLSPVGVLAEERVTDEQWTHLLDPNLSQWDVYLSYPGDVIMRVIQGKAPADLKPIGLNRDTKKVFSVIEDRGELVLRISGEIYGAAATKQEFSNYHFKAKFKWGEKKWEPRLQELKDSGILYHSVGPFGVDYWHSWMESQEFQIIEAGIGDYWTIAGARIDIPARKPPGQDVFQYAPDAPVLQFAANTPSAAANHCRRGEDREIPNAWNQVELICFADRCLHIANGGVVMALQNSQHMREGELVPLTRGKIQIQSEAAEVFFKDIRIKPLKSVPSEYARYFNAASN